MILKKVALGNAEEAFIEERFSNGLNIFYSNDNNKGKTIIVQSIMYSIGNTPVFPTSLNISKYYFYSMFEHQGRILEFLRHGNSILVKESEQISVFDTITDFKIYFNESIYRLPRFVKDGKLVISDLGLFYQTFYLPQDKRNTSSIINGGQYNKTDFIAMLKSLINPSFTNIDSTEIERIKSKKKELIQKIAVISGRISFLKANPLIAKQVLQSANNIDFQEQSTNLQIINQQISEYSVKRNRENNRLFKLENLLNELNSLNRNIEIGKIKCADCGSEKIVYSNGDFTFEVSNDFVRKEIITSIQKQIDNKRDSIQEYSNQISELQKQLQEKLRTIPVEVTDIIISRDAILNENENEKSLVELSNALNECVRQLDQHANLEKTTYENVNTVINSIIKMMQDYYSQIDEVDNSNIDGLFTKNNVNFSGSEEQIFYFSKLVSLAKNIDLDFPIIVDCFRDGEISTEKEEVMVEEFKKLKKQVLLTATLKAQEYTAAKYAKADSINAVDYSSVQPNKLLQNDKIEDFLKLIKTFNLEI